MILGLSHLFGESGDAEAAADFWIHHGWRLSLGIELPVPPAKQALLANRDASGVTLRYLVRSDAANTPGIEFVTHSPRTPMLRSRPRLTLCLPGAPVASVHDAEGNIVTVGACHPPTVQVSTPNIAATRDRLRSLGFTGLQGRDDTVSLTSRLFPRRGVTVSLRLAPELSDRPRLDDGGWNGMSLLVRDLDEAARRLPLVAHQEFSVCEGDRREVAFYVGDGLLLEFLMIAGTARRSKSATNS